MTEYGVAGAHFKGAGSFSVGGWFFTHSFHQLWEQFIAALWNHRLDRLRHGLVSIS